MTDEDPVTLRIADGAATLTLNRPESLNSWNEALGEHLRDALATCANDDSVRAVMITGAGRAFSSGADLREHRADADGAPDLGERLGELYNPSILAVREMDKPVLAAVNGAAAGIGCALALACDLIIAAESSFFLLAFVNIGLVRDGGATAPVAARIGASRAAEMAMLGERVPAPKALEWGLINRVAPDAELEAAAAELLTRLATGPTLALGRIKQLLNRSTLPHVADQLEAEAAAQREQGHTTDFIEGVIAFSEKRPPRFSGTGAAGERDAVGRRQEEAGPLGCSDRVICSEKTLRVVRLLDVAKARDGTFREHVLDVCGHLGEVEVEA